MAPGRVSAVLTAAGSLAIGCCLLAAGADAPTIPSPSRSFQQQSEEPAWAATVRVWRTAVEDHQPGTVDAPVVGLNAWSQRDLAMVVIDIRALADMLAKARTSHVPRSGVIKYNGYALRISEIEDLLGVTPDEAARVDINPLLRRAAILHTDIPTLVESEVVTVQSAAARTLRTEDGRIRGFQGTMHWEVARSVLDAVTPSPSADAFVRSWYRATAAFLLYAHDLANAEPHLEHARVIFPADADLLFASGCLYEAYASPLVQAVVRSADPRLNVSVKDAAANRREAERFFRQALAANPGLAPARLHLGRVIGLLGRHGEAIAELQRAAAAPGDTLLHYYAELFLGGEERALGNNVAARAHYERAAQASPSAPSPYLALSEIGRREGDRTAALGAIERAFSTAAGHPADPWWLYHDVAFQDAESQLAACRREVATRKQP